MPCSLGLSATSQQYFSLTTNQPPATSQQYSSLRTNQHQPSVTGQPNRLSVSHKWNQLYFSDKCEKIQVESKANLCRNGRVALTHQVEDKTKR
jgi:hypothetical protein